MRNLLYIILMIAMAGIASPVFGLTVSPVKLEISGDPGQTLIEEIELLNEQSETKIFYSSF